MVYQAIEKLTTLFLLAPVSDITISGVLSLHWKDFEDAVQFMVAKENDVEYIITRNEIDYKNSDVPCISPAEFVVCFKRTKQ